MKKFYNKMPHGVKWSCFIIFIFAIVFFVYKYIYDKPEYTTDKVCHRDEYGNCVQQMSEEELKEYHSSGNFPTTGE